MLPDGHLREALTFDDVLLVPAESDVIPKDVDVRTQLTPGIRLAIPIVSSAMDTVTEAATAIAMAREGGIGIVHKNMSISDQALEVTKVKKAETGVVVNPVTVGPEQKLAAAVELMRRHEISGLPVVAADGRPVGILTNRDIRFERNLDQPVSAMMTKQLITIGEGTSLEAAKGLLHKNRIEKLLVIGGDGLLKGLVTIKDIEKAQQHPYAAKDDFGRLRVGAAVGVGPDRDERVDALLEGGLRRHLHRHGARPRARRRPGGRRRAPQLPQGPDHRGQRGDGRGRAGAVQGRRGRRQGRHRPRIDLHDPRRRRRRRSPDHRHQRRAPRRWRRPTPTWSPTAASSTRATSPRRSPPARTR